MGTLIISSLLRRLISFIVLPLFTILGWDGHAKTSMLSWELGRVALVVDPTRSMGRRDSLLNENKMWVDFRILENPSPRRNSFSLDSPLTFYCYFIKGKTK